MPSITAWISSIGVTMLLITPSRISLAVELAEVAARRAAIVVDEDVRLGAGGEQRCLDRRVGDVAGDLLTSHAEPVAHFRCGRGQGRRVAAVDAPVAAGFGQRHRAAPAEPLLEAQTIAFLPRIPRSMSFPPP